MTANRIPQTKSKTIKTYWQPLGAEYWCETTTTLEEGKEYECDWVANVEAGQNFFKIEYPRGCHNPGTLMVIVNVI